VVVIEIAALEDAVHDPIDAALKAANGRLQDLAAAPLQLGRFEDLVADRLLLEVEEEVGRVHVEEDVLQVEVLILYGLAGAFQAVVHLDNFKALLLRKVLESRFPRLFLSEKTGLALLLLLALTVLQVRGCLPVGPALLVPALVHIPL